LAGETTRISSLSLIIRFFYKKKAEGSVEFKFILILLKGVYVSEGLRTVCFVIQIFLYLELSFNFMVDFTSENLGKILIERLKANPNFNEIISIVKNNSKGNIFLVGGTISRTLASELYGGKQKNQDFDFVVDVLNEDLKVPNA